MKTYILAALLLAFTPFMTLQAQEKLPELPEPLQNLAAEGAQIRFLGYDHGLEGWLTVKNGQQQYFYVMPGGGAFMMGLLFDKDGKVVTIRQVQKLQGQGDDLLDTLASDIPGQNNATDQYEFKTPSEQMFSDVEGANWIPLGAPDAPPVYAFVDPMCPHCHAFIDDIRDDIDDGKIQLRIVPVGFKPDTRAQSAFLIAAPNPQERWFKHMQGDEAALPVKSDINDQGVQRNLAVMQSWEFDATPMVTYRDKAGTIKIIRGRPQTPADILSDIGS